MTEWLDVPDGLEKSEREKFNGVTLNVTLSPYNLPIAARGMYDKASDRFVIDFKYLDDEQCEPRGGNGPVTFRVGVKSKRLCSIVVDVKTLRAEQVKLNLRVTATEELHRRLKELQASGGLKLNYRLVEDLLSDPVGDKLMQPVPAA